LFTKARYSGGREREGEVKMCGIFIVGDVKYIKMWVGLLDQMLGGMKYIKMWTTIFLPQPPCRLAAPPFPSPSFPAEDIIFPACSGVT
jgi:hypothetical protein